MLEHLILYPRGGLCNRLRAIASAKRLAARAGARCTIIWEWGDYHALFDDDTEWIPYPAQTARDRNEIVAGYHHVRHLLQGQGGNHHNRRVPMHTYPRLLVASHYVFGGDDEPTLTGYEQDVWPWFPRPRRAVLEKVDAFRRASFPARVAGLHMRRADNREARLHSPDRAYWKEADRLTREGYHLFLATDHAQTLQMMQERYGSRLLHYPKTASLEKRWPREITATEDVVEDLVDLWLLGACERVIGSSWSSYSRVALLLNGSPQSKIIDEPLPRWRFGLQMWWKRAGHTVFKGR